MANEARNDLSNKAKIVSSKSDIETLAYLQSISCNLTDRIMTKTRMIVQSMVNMHKSMVALLSY